MEVNAPSSRAPSSSMAIANIVGELTFLGGSPRLMAHFSVVEHPGTSWPPWRRTAWREWRMTMTNRAYESWDSSWFTPLDGHLPCSLVNFRRFHPRKWPSTTWWNRPCDLTMANIGTHNLGLCENGDTPQKKKHPKMGGKWWHQPLESLASNFFWGGLASHLTIQHWDLDLQLCSSSRWYPKLAGWWIFHGTSYEKIRMMTGGTPMT